MPRSRSAAAVPGPIAATVTPGERAGVEARVVERLHQQLGAVRARQAQRRRSRRSASASTASRTASRLDARLDPDRRHLDDLGAELVQSRGEPARLRARPGDRHAASVQRRLLEPGEPLARAPPPARRRSPPAAGSRPPRASSAISSSVPVTVRWPGSVPRSTTAAGSSAARPCRCSAAATCGSDAHAHVEDERPGERGQRRPVERALGLCRDPRAPSRTRPPRPASRCVTGMPA